MHDGQKIKTGLGNLEIPLVERRKQQEFIW